MLFLSCILVTSNGFPLPPNQQKTTTQNTTMWCRTCCIGRGILCSLAGGRRPPRSAWPHCRVWLEWKPALFDRLPHPVFLSSPLPFLHWSLAKVLSDISANICVYIHIYIYIYMYMCVYAVTTGQWNSVKARLMAGSTLYYIYLFIIVSS